MIQYCMYILCCSLENFPVVRDKPFGISSSCSKAFEVVKKGYGSHIWDYVQMDGYNDTACIQTHPNFVAFNQSTGLDIRIVA